MSVSSKWIAQGELLQIHTLCQALDTLTETMQDLPDISVPFMEDGEGGGITMPVYDSNGDVLGHIGHAEGGFGLYLDTLMMLDFDAED